MRDLLSADLARSQFVIVHQQLLDFMIGKNVPTPPATSITGPIAQVS